MNITPTKHLFVRDWKENVVNIVQYPRAKCCPNMSPFSLKVETFCRLFEVPFRNVNNEFKHGSVKGLVPFIELNGRHHADSNSIMEFLTKEYSLPIDNLTPKQKSDARAYTIMLEGDFFPGMIFLRGINPKWMFSEDQGALGNLRGLKKTILKTIGPAALKSNIKKRLFIQGMGRNNQDEVEEIVKKDLRALSNLLGDQPYFFGEKPNSFDVTAFAHLAMLLSCPQPNDNVLKFVESSTSNLKSFFDRVKDLAWPDWDHVCQTLELNPKTEEEKQAEAAAQESKK
ncbi:hypothetical protein FO519_009041 [Halicephalobus sp. NKZ332]|nr:hypothetical protein FO519_009041 [Halicephalobus sp. NKZ332]